MSSQVIDPNFLEEYELEETWAPKHGITRRTSFRYRNEPNGLPFLIWGQQVYIPKKEGAEYIRSRIKRRNPRGRRRSIRDGAGAEAATA
jgi:hypothetical protein